LAMKVLRAVTARQVYRATRRKCANGCGHPATALDTECGKHLCWFHLIMEHPLILDPRKIGKELDYIYYG
jgi:hypothetical protein